MPLPAWLTRVNQRFTNKVMGLLADDVPPLAALHTVGRRSGRRYRTPVLAFRTRRGIAIALTYGTDVQWWRNVRAANGARLVLGRRVLVLSEPVLLHGAEAHAVLPRWIRPALRLLRVPDVVELAARPGPGAR